MNSAKLQIGILDLQGCVQEHIPHLKALDVDVIRVKNAQDLCTLDGLIIPGGESSTQLKLLESFALESELMTLAKKIPFWGICAERF